MGKQLFHRSVLLVTLLGLWAIPLAAQPFRTAFGQPYGTTFSNAERLLLFRLGTGRTSYRNFQRYLFAAEALQQAETPPPSEIARQRNAGALALRNRQSISNALRTGESQLPAPAPLINSDVVTIWHTFGLSFNQADPKAIQAVAPQYTGGLAIAAIAVNGPADKAGWQSGDILLGLYKFQTTTYADVAYVATMPDLASLGPLRAILLRTGKVMASQITPSDQATMAAEADTSTRTIRGEPPQTQSAEQRSLSPNERAVEADIVWDVIGVRVVTTPVSGIEKVNQGAKILAVRPGSAAANAGWEVGNVLIGLDGFQMASVADLYYIATDPDIHPDDPLPTKIVKDGATSAGSLRLTTKP